MTEQLLQYIWKFRLFNAEGLKTVDGIPVEILKTGDQNHDSGADFSNARLRIGDMVWAGNVEIELESANWERHGHSTDASHKNTLLLVCLENNLKMEIALPIVELKDRVNNKLENIYQDMMASLAFIPCQQFINRVDGFTLQSWWLRILAERLEQKIGPVLTSLIQNKNNWEETFYHFLARNFGFNTNAVPFELLAKSIPLTVLAKHKNSLLQLEALLLGQSGLLKTEKQDTFTGILATDYKFLSHKYSLSAINPALWKFSKTRPANFPTVRIAQFAALIHASSHLFSKILEIEKPKQLQKLFEIKTSPYWENHYRPGTEVPAAKTTLGDDAIQNILINTVAPFLFAYGHSKNNDDYKQRALNLLESLPKESNTIIRRYEDLDIKPQTAADSQAILQMYKHWCSAKKCLQCRIGHKVLSG